MSQRFCKACKGWHSLDDEWPSACLSHYRVSHGFSMKNTIIKDIDPYKPIAVDKNTGQRPVIGGRRQHKEFLRNNGYTEIGNDFVQPKREESTRAERVADIRRAMNDF